MSTAKPPPRGPRPKQPPDEGPELELLLAAALLVATLFVFGLGYLAGEHAIRESETDAIAQMELAREHELQALNALDRVKGFLDTCVLKRQQCNDARAACVRTYDQATGSHQ